MFFDRPFCESSLLFHFSFAIDVLTGKVILLGMGTKDKDFRYMFLFLDSQLQIEGARYYTRFCFSLIVISALPRSRDQVVSRKVGFAPPPLS